MPQLILTQLAGPDAYLLQRTQQMVWQPQRQGLTFRLVIAQQATGSAITSLNVAPLVDNQAPLLPRLKDQAIETVVASHLIEQRLTLLQGGGKGLHDTRDSQRKTDIIEEDEDEPMQIMMRIGQRDINAENSRQWPIVEEKTKGQQVENHTTDGHPQAK